MKKDEILKIKPYVGINNIYLGESRKVIRSKIEADCDPLDNNDYYHKENLIFEYEDDKLVNVNVCEGRPLFFQDKDLSSIGYNEFLDFVISLGEYQNSGVGDVDSLEYGFGAYFPSFREFPEEPAQAIAVFTKGYWDDLIK